MPHDHAGLKRTLKSLRGQWLDARRSEHLARELAVMASLNRNLEVLYDLIGADMTTTEPSPQPPQPNPSPQPDPGQPQPAPQPPTQ